MCKPCAVNTVPFIAGNEMFSATSALSRTVQVLRRFRVQSHVYSHVCCEQLAVAKRATMSSNEYPVLITDSRQSGIL